ncbi:MAG: ABC transporter ATP-binding protein [Acidobacteriota bacterium]
MNSPSAFTVRGVSFAYPGGPLVLDGVSLAVPRGSVLGVLGPNGSGKSTLLKLLAGTLSPAIGSVEMDGHPLGAFTRRDIARRVAVVPQETHSTFDFSVLDIVMMGRYPHLGPFTLEGPDDVAVARAALAATGTSGLETRPFATLSGGERQRVVIASALAQTSDTLLLDEPTAALDPGFQFDISLVLARLNKDRGTTLVISTHDLNLAATLCTDLLLLKAGRAIAHGPTDDVLTRPHVRALYGMDAEIARHPSNGRLMVVPLARID